MQRKPMIGINPNPHSLKALPADKIFWQDKDIQEIRKLLWDALINKNATFALPEHDNLQALLTVINNRLRECVTEDVVKSCDRFALHLQMMGEKSNESWLGEDYLQVSAAVNFYLGRYAEAAQLAGVLGDAYFLHARLETDSFSSHFNEIAAFAYQEAGNVEEASHYFNQYLQYTISADHRPQEVQAAAAYLQQNRTLVCTSGLLRVLQAMAESCGDDKQLSANLMRQADSAECFSMFEDLDRRKIQTHLQELHMVVHDNLLKDAIANQSQAADVASPKTGLSGLSGLFAKKAGVGADPVVTDVPRFK